MSKELEVINYLKLHLVSLEQDSEEIQKELDRTEDLDSDEWETANIEDIRLNGQISATRHLLSVVADILGINLEKEKVNANI